MKTAMALLTPETKSSREALYAWWPGQALSFRVLARLPIWGWLPFLRPPPPPEEPSMSVDKCFSLLRLAMGAECCSWPLRHLEPKPQINGCNAAAVARVH